MFAPFVLLGMCTYADHCEFVQRIRNVHDRYVGNKLSDEQFYEKHKVKLYDIFEFMGSNWGVTLETFSEATGCSDSDIISCVPKYKHDLFGFLASYAMNEIEHSWTLGY